MLTKLGIRLASHISSTALLWPLSPAELWCLRRWVGVGPCSKFGFLCSGRLCCTQLMGSVSGTSTTACLSGRPVLAPVVLSGHGRCHFASVEEKVFKDLAISLSS